VLRSCCRSEQQELSDRQELLYADNRYSLLVIFQGMDASGKDGTIRHVMSGINPQGMSGDQFRAAECGRAGSHFLSSLLRSVFPSVAAYGIFNRSWYEEVFVVRVHPPVLAGQQLPPGKRGESVLAAAI
jgi:polyphosphate kinase 2 (PPK2 family)